MTHLDTLYIVLFILTSCLLTRSKPLSPAPAVPPPDIFEEAPGEYTVCTDSYKWTQPLFPGVQTVDTASCDSAIADFTAAVPNMDTVYTFQTTVTDANTQQAVNRIYGDGELLSNTVDF